MPYIRIDETEQEAIASFDVTENTVLIPLLYARQFSNAEGPDYGYTETEADCKARLFTSAAKLKAWLATGGGLNGGGPRYIHIGELGLQSKEIDRSYVMAYELLLQGLNVVIKPILFDNAAYWIPGETARQTVVPYEKVQEILEDAVCNRGDLKEFEDRNNFNIKFITTGGYPNLGIVRYEDDSEGTPVSSNMHTKITELAANRKDAVALLELREDIISEQELLAELDGKVCDDNDVYSAAFFPWSTFKVSADAARGEVEYSLPAGFGYLMAYANSVKSNANWFAAAGVNRGYIPNMTKPNFNVGEALMHILQGEESYTVGQETKFLGIRVNPIMNAGTYGNRIWGNRVYKPKVSTALKDQYREFLNVRILLCDIKKQVYHAAMRTTFEPNDDIVWINFKTLCNSLLDTMKSGRGLKWYKWEKEKSEEYATIKAKLWVIPIEAVESFNVNVILTSEEVTVEEE